MKQEQSFVVCPACKGLGQQYQLNKDGTPYLMHGNPVVIPCEYCDGQHVVLERITTEHFLITPKILEEETTKKGGIFDKWRRKK